MPKWTHQCWVSVSVQMPRLARDLSATCEHCESILPTISSLRTSNKHTCERFQPLTRQKKDEKGIDGGARKRRVTEMGVYYSFIIKNDVTFCSLDMESTVEAGQRVM
jgi:hypothetical protein